MKRLIPALPWQALALALALVALGVSGVPASQTHSASEVVAVAGGPPGPDCGPTFQWSCVVPGCPSCPEYYFAGTVCEKNQYEKQTGQVCSPI